MKTILFSKSFAASALGMMLTFGSAAGLYSCSDDEFLAKVNIPEEKTITTGLEAKEQVLEFDIESDSEWSIDFDKAGNHIAYVYPRSGKGNAKVKLHVLPNFDEVARSGNMHINFANNPSQNKDIAIVQKAKTDGEDNYNPDLLGEQSYGLGWGYDTSIGTNATKCLKYPVIMSEFLQEAKVVGKASDSKFSIREHTYTGSTVAELKSDFEAKAEFEGGGFGFNAELNATFNMNDFSNEQYEYAMSYVDITAERNLIKKPAFSLTTETAMVPEAYELLNNADEYPNGADTYHTIVEYYGTHVIVKSSLGGRLNIGTKVNTSKVTKEYDLHAFAKLSYSGIVEASASAEETYKQTWEENKKACETTITAIGGSDEFKHKIATTTGDEQADAVKEWIADITTNGTGSFIAIADSSDLVPIWTFVKDPQRKKELQEYIETGQYKYPSDKTNYDLGVQGHLTNIGELIGDMNSNSYDETLIKRVTIGKDGNKTIALICSEFIPEINEKGRVAVFYPVINGIPKFNLGLFLGNEYTKPAKICNYGDKMIIKPMTERDLYQYDDVYLRGPLISLDEIEDVNDIIEASVSDYTVPMWKNNLPYNYSLVKVRNNLWMRENYASSEVNGFHFNYMNDPYNPDYYYYNLASTSARETTEGWKLPQKEDISLLINLCNKNNINFAKEALLGGCMGTDIVQGGYFQSSSFFNSGYIYIPLYDKVLNEYIPCLQINSLNKSAKIITSPLSSSLCRYYYPIRYVKPIE